MLHVKIFILLSTALVFSNGQSCSEGSTSLRNNMYYVCRNGNQVPIACASPNGIRIDMNQEHRDANFVYRCEQPHSQVYQLVPIACIKNGRTVYLNSDIVDGNYWYTCSQQGNTIQLRAGGCVDERNNRVGGGALITRGNVVYQCQDLGSGGFRVTVHGCEHEGRQYPMGSDMIGRDMWLQCRARGDGLEITIGGCVDNGRKYNHGDTVVQNNFVRRCNVAGNSVGWTLSGCVADDGRQYQLGESWREGSGLMQYVVECKREGQYISKGIRQCFYQGPEGSGPLDPNCVRRFGNTMVKCIRNGQQWSGEIIQNANDQTIRDAVNQGYRQC